MGPSHSASAKRRIEPAGRPSEKRQRLAAGTPQTGSSEKKPQASAGMQRADISGVAPAQVGKAQGVKAQKRMEAMWPPTDEFATELAQILDHRGGVSYVPHVARLESLMANEQRLNYRWTLLTIIELSSEECLRAVVRGPGLQVCKERMFHSSLLRWCAKDQALSQDCSQTFL